MRKTEQIDDPPKFFHYLTSDEVIVVDANLVSDDIMEIQYEYGENFVEANPNTNVIIAAFTTAYARLQLCDELDMLGLGRLSYATGSTRTSFGKLYRRSHRRIGRRPHYRFCFGRTEKLLLQNQPGKTEIKVRGITLDCTARQKVNFKVLCALVFLHAECGVTGKATVDIPFRISRNTKTKEIQTKRMKKDYKIVYNKRVITQNYKTLPYGY